MRVRFELEQVSAFVGIRNCITDGVISVLVEGHGVAMLQTAISPEGGCVRPLAYSGSRPADEAQAWTGDGCWS